MGARWVFRFLMVLSFVLVLASDLFSGVIEDRWDELLKTYVRVEELKGVQVNTVDYEALMADQGFARLVRRLDRFSLRSLRSDAQKKAFWINVYNIAVVKLVTDENRPLKSIRDLNGWTQSVWNKPAIQVSGSWYKLSDIKHSILRQFKDARVLFAISDATLSGPDLARDVYRSARIDRQLDAQVRRFLKKEKKGFRLDTTDRVIYLSDVFRRFKRDFSMHFFYQSQSK